jgi:acetylornithine/succinyldiaminopimelate/putrescine aminotransferase
MMLTDVSLSLAGLLGDDYTTAVCQCAVKLYGIDGAEADRLAHEPVGFYDESAQARQDELLEQVGSQFIQPFLSNNTGAPTFAFGKAANLKAAPLGGLGLFRVGEDGRLYLAAKSEHYHTPLGHGFGGYRLIDRAKRLGIPNATHNNTRGYITRLLERELVRCANGLEMGDGIALDAVLHSTEPKMLNRVINLETGSLAVEAGLKMMLAKFYRLDAASGHPWQGGRIPVFLVMADNNGGLEANYHGTTVIAQTLRGMWPEFRQGCENAGMYKVVGVNLNDIADFHEKIAQYNRGPYKTAGFLHEIVLMNYGGIRLREEYLGAAYRLCRDYGTPVLVDEIQSCMWYEGLLLYRLYGLSPDFVILGKGFSGGEYPASRILTTCEMDSLNLFGALVTNGQEELASLAYLVTMAYAEANGREIRRKGEFFQEMLRAFAARYPCDVERVEGRGHLAAIHFKTVEAASRFAGVMNGFCIDVSAQTYKANCPPAALVKLPWIASEKAMEYILARMDEAIGRMSAM